MVIGLPNDEYIFKYLFFFKLKKKSVIILRFSIVKIYQKEKKTSNTFEILSFDKFGKYKFDEYQTIIILNFV
jgi:hypothetical protein